MAQALTDERIERLQLEYDQTGSVPKAAAAVGVSKSTASKYIDREKKHPAPPEVQAVRTKKLADIAERLGDLQVVLIEAMMRPDKINEARYAELATSLGIATEKRLLITGQPTVRNETLTTDPASRLTPDEMEAAARIRAKLAAEAS